MNTTNYKMKGLENLYRLSKNIKQEIIKYFGGISDFYQKVFDLNHLQYTHYLLNGTYSHEIKKELYDIVDKLESFGVPDGSDIIDEIATDFNSIIVSKQVIYLNKYLELLGTDFKKIQKWLNDNYGI